MSPRSRGGLRIGDVRPFPGTHRVFVARRLVPVILTLVVLHGAAIAQTYRWVDEQGEIHFTDDVNSIPPQYRPRVDAPGVGPMTPPARPPASPVPGSPGSGPRSAPGGTGVALWLRTGGHRGEQGPVLIQVYDSEEACRVERDRRTAVHVSQGMQRTNQPGLVMSNKSGTPMGETYFAYQCAPAGIRPP